MKSLVYAVNALTQAVTVGGQIGFGSIIRRTGCNCNVSGGTAYVNGVGYYDIDSKFTFTSGDAGIVIITLYADGVAIPGATASITVAPGDTYTVSIPAVYRSTNCGAKSITAVANGVAISVSNASIKIVRY